MEEEERMTNGDQDHYYGPPAMNGEKLVFFSSVFPSVSCFSALSFDYVPAAPQLERDRVKHSRWRKISS